MVTFVALHAIQLSSITLEVYMLFSYQLSSMTLEMSFNVRYITSLSYIQTPTVSAVALCREGRVTFPLSHIYQHYFCA